MHAIYIGPVGQPKKERSMQSHGRAVSPKKEVDELHVQILLTHADES
jgi:hypothetical protein